MIWKALRLLQPLLPVAIDYATSRGSEARARTTAVERSVDSVEQSLVTAGARLSHAEAAIELVTRACEQQGEELLALREASASTALAIRRARIWLIALLAWNLILTVLLLVSLTR